jgi:hypothetical protein
MSFLSFPFSYSRVLILASNFTLVVTWLSTARILSDRGGADSGGLESGEKSGSWKCGRRVRKVSEVQS